MTGRWRWINEDIPVRLQGDGKPVILALWHNRLAMMGFAWRQNNTVTVLASAHRDGQIIARILQRFGFATVSGSSSKGGAEALRQLVKMLNDGCAIGITPDGPRGPSGNAAPGLITMARLSGAPIVPMAYATTRFKRLKTWDRFFLPLPFGKGVFLWGDPIYVNKDASKADMEDMRLTVQQAIDNVTARAEQLAAAPDAVLNAEHGGRRTS